MLLCYIFVFASRVSITMIPEYQNIIHVKISNEAKTQIEKLVQEGKFKNISQVVRAALKEYLKED